jgi:hypothetical protein
VVPHAESAFSLRVSDFSLNSEYDHGLHLGRAPQLRPGLFVGRDAELKRLSQLLLAGSLTRNVVVIAAVGGIGKTQLAITHAERYHHKYSSVFWLDAKDELILKQGLAALADIVLEQGQARTTIAANEDNVVKQVIYWFSLPHNNRWLLILDNYDNPKLPRHERLPLHPRRPRERLHPRAPRNIPQRQVPPHSPRLRGGLVALLPRLGGHLLRTNLSPHRLHETHLLRPLPPPHERDMPRDRRSRTA